MSTSMCDSPTTAVTPIVPKVLLVVIVRVTLRRDVLVATLSRLRATLARGLSVTLSNVKTAFTTVMTVMVTAMLLLPLRLPLGGIPTELDRFTMVVVL